MAVGDGPASMFSRCGTQPGITSVCDRIRRAILVLAQNRQEDQPIFVIQQGRGI
jgi:hypothetical protein